MLIDREANRLIVTYLYIPIKAVRFPHQILHPSTSLVFTVSSNTPPNAHTEILNTNFKMSAPNAGRQSPEPEKQSDAQTGQTSSNVNDQGGAPSQGAEKSSDNTKSGLSSNPEHPLAKHAEETTSKKA
jgi:hypothetical protein